MTAESERRSGSAGAWARETGLSADTNARSGQRQTAPGSRELRRRLPNGRTGATGGGSATSLSRRESRYTPDLATDAAFGPFAVSTLAGGASSCRSAAARRTAAGVEPWPHDALPPDVSGIRTLYFGPRLKRMNEGASLRAATKSSRPSPLRSPAAMP